MLAALAAGCAQRPQPQDLSVHSAVLSAFWARPVSLKAQILLPQSYEQQPRRRYPLLFWIPPFGGSYRIGLTWTKRWLQAETAGHEMIVVSPDPYLAAVHTAFADSANTGPWGHALTSELLPQVEKRYRVEAGHVYVAGLSSGGWSALWLQTHYASLFAGCWAVAPDPVDFHDFAGVDLFSARNFYAPHGTEAGFYRRAGRDVTTMRSFVQRTSDGRLQFDSFDAVFSPRARSGTPRKLFDRRTGAIDGDVASYWIAHYDIDRQLAQRWPHEHAQMAGKVHIIVGTQDTFHLDGAVRRADAELRALRARAQVDYVEGADHFDVLQKGAVTDRIAAAMNPEDGP